MLSQQTEQRGEDSGKDGWGSYEVKAQAFSSSRDPWGILKSGW